MPTLLHYSDVKNAFDRPERVARLAAAVQTPADAVVVGSGDVLAPGALANEHEGRQVLPFFGAARPAAETFGNHDFDFGTNALQAIVKESPQPWVSANVTLPDVDVPQSTIVERNDGRISITGTRTTPASTTAPRAAFVPLQRTVMMHSDAFDHATDVLPASHNDPAVTGEPTSFRLGDSTEVLYVPGNPNYWEAIERPTATPASRGPSIGPR